MSEVAPAGTVEVAEVESVGTVEVAEVCGRRVPRAVAEGVVCFLVSAECSDDLARFSGAGLLLVCAAEPWKSEKKSH